MVMKKSVAQIDPVVKPPMMTGPKPPIRVAPKPEPLMAPKPPIRMDVKPIPVGPKPVLRPGMVMPKPGMRPKRKRKLSSTGYLV
jgi:hypothetical protein